MEIQNSMNAIISIVMIGVGFVSGMGWSNLFRLQQIGELQRQLYAEKCLKDSYQQCIETLENQNKHLKEAIVDNDEKLEAIKIIANIRTHLPPPPNTPLARSEPLLRSSSSTSDLSPIALNNTD